MLPPKPTLLTLLTLALALFFIYNLYLRSIALNIDRLRLSSYRSPFAFFGSGYDGSNSNLLGGGSRLGSGNSKTQATVGEYADLVNVFIGTTGGGHVFPGATVPHGMVKAGMDTDSPGNHAGYDALPQYKVTGFSQLHDDGTGGDIPLSNFKLFPIVSCALSSTPPRPLPGQPPSQPGQSSFESCTTSIYQRAVPRRLKDDGTPDDAGSPGYFASNLSTGVRVELTATRRTALHRYTFPAPPPSSPPPSSPPSTSSPNDNSPSNPTGEVAAMDEYLPRILVDITNDGRRSGVQARVTIDPETGRVTGGAQFRASFGDGTYHAYTCVDFRSPSSPSTPIIPVEYGIYERSRITPNATSFSDTFGGERGAILSFPFTPSHFPSTSASSNNDDEGTATTTILARVGVSLISTQQACTNAESEIPDFDFERTQLSARAEWNDLLGRFRVDAGGVGVRKERVALFYSSVYRTHIVPADYSGENPLWVSDAPYFDSLYCNWDTFRTLYPLFSLHSPHLYTSIIRSFIDIQQHEGWLPECRGATVQQHVQGGSSGDVVLAEWWVKFQKHADTLGVSAEEVYTALLQDAEVEAPNWGLAGRQAEAWKRYGYLPVGAYSPGGMNTRQVSRTLEYAFEDFVIAMVARSLSDSNSDGAGAKEGKDGKEWMRFSEWIKASSAGSLSPSESDLDLDDSAGGEGIEGNMENEDDLGDEPKHPHAPPLGIKTSSYSPSFSTHSPDRYYQDFLKYANRSRGFEYLWDPTVPILTPFNSTSTSSSNNNATEVPVPGIQGFMQLRHINGSFIYTDPRRCTVNDPGGHTCYFDGINRDGFYEGGSIVYSQYVPHDTARLIELQGGDEAFIRRLDFIFDNGYFDSTNEPSQQIPFMYHYANRPGLSTERSREAIAQSYNLSVNGLPGNDDSGAMASYVAFTLLGLYPLPGTRQFLISSPYFPRVEIHNPLFGKTTTIVVSRGWADQGEDGGEGSIYVKSIKIDGKPWHSVCYIEWDVFERGATVELELTDDRTVPCGEGPEALPPSLSTGGYD